MWFSEYRYGSSHYILFSHWLYRVLVHISLEAGILFAVVIYHKNNNDFIMHNIDLLKYRILHFGEAVSTLAFKTCSLLCNISLSVIVLYMECTALTILSLEPFSYLCVCIWNLNSCVVDLKSENLKLTFDFDLLIREPCIYFGSLCRWKHFS